MKKIDRLDLDKKIMQIVSLRNSVEKDLAVLDAELTAFLLEDEYHFSKSVVGFIRRTKKALLILTNPVVNELYEYSKIGYDKKELKKIKSLPQQLAKVKK